MSLSESPTIQSDDPGPPRRSLACQRCRRRKIKCEIDQGSCSACARLGILCIRPQKRAIPSNLIPHQGDLESLEAEVAQLTGRAAELGILPSDPSGPSPQGTNSARRSATGDGALRGGTGATLRSPQEHDETSRPKVDWGNFGELTGNRTVRNPGLPPFEYDIKRMVWAAVGVNGHLPRESRLENTLLADMDLSSNAMKVGASARRYVELYLDTFSGSLPFLDPQTIWEQFEETAASNAGSASTSPVLLMILSLGAKVAPGDDQQAGFHSSIYLLAAVRLYSQALAPDSLELLHFLLILSLYSIFSPHGGSTWHLLGLAMQTALRLGLHQASVPDRSSTPKHDGTSAFWCTYILDRCIALIYGRPFGIADADINVLAPSVDSDGPFQGLARLVALASKASVESLADAEGATASDLFASQVLDPDFLENLSSSKVVPMTAVFTGVLSTFSASSSNRLADVQYSRQTAGVVRLAQLFPLKGWPLPWILGHAAFHCSLSAAAARALDAQKGAFGATEGRRAPGLPFASGAEELHCLSCAGFEEVRLLAGLHRELIRGDDDVSDEVLSRLGAIPNTATKKLARALIVLKI